MKKNTRNLILPIVRVVILSLAAGSRLSAQTFTTLYSFTPAVGANSLGDPINSDGARPSAGLILSGKALYGTAESGGDSGWGTVFSVNTDGTRFATLHSFIDGTGQNSGGWPINTDGVVPGTGLISSGQTLYGTAEYGGASGNGTVFKVNNDGSGFTTLHSFTDPDYNNGGTNSDGASPQGGLILSGTALYGTALFGGGSGKGTVFAINTDGSGFITLHSFGGSDGASPSGSLALSSNTLYGTTFAGGDSDYGTAFKIKTDGTDFASIYSFTRGSDGAYPRGKPVLWGNMLYGAAGSGGDWGHGTVFALKTDGTDFTVLHAFTTTNGSPVTNADGATPEGLLLSGSTLYGTAGSGGDSGLGTVFAVNIDGSGFTTLHSFAAGGNDANNTFTNSDGANPAAGLILAGNVLYGTVAHGGASGNGALFSLSLLVDTPQLTITSASGHVILSWPTNFAGFTLQSTTDLGPSAIWTTDLPAPEVVNGLNRVTSPLTASQQFFRLSQ